MGDVNYEMHRLDLTDSSTTDYFEYLTTNRKLLKISKCIRDDEFIFIGETKYECVGMTVIIFSRNIAR